MFPLSPDLLQMKVQKYQNTTRNFFKHLVEVLVKETLGGPEAEGMFFGSFESNVWTFNLTMNI